MRFRSWLIITAVFFAGAATGLLLPRYWNSRPGSTTGELGTELMGRVGRHFIADDRGRRGQESGVVFFDTPKPYSLWLCRVNAYWIPSKVITGKLKRPQDWWEDELSLERRYGIWRRPTSPEPAEGARDRACAAFRDFDNTFVEEEGGEPERAAYLLDTILADARSATPLRYPVSCMTLHQHSELEPRPCDAKSVLTRLSLRGLRRGKTLSSKYNPDRGISRDELSILSSAPFKSVRLTVDSEQHWGRHSSAEGEVKAVKVEEMVAGH